MTRYLLYPSLPSEHDAMYNLILRTKQQTSNNNNENFSRIGGINIQKNCFEKKIQK